MKQKYYFGIFSLFVIVLLGVGMVSAMGFKNRISEDERDVMRVAIENNDFESWKNFRNRFNENMKRDTSEERFEELTSKRQEREEFKDLLREARESGDIEEMNRLKQEFGSGKGFHKRNLNSHPCSH